MKLGPVLALGGVVGAGVLAYRAWRHLNAEASVGGWRGHRWNIGQILYSDDGVIGVVSGLRPNPSGDGFLYDLSADELFGFGDIAYNIPGRKLHVLSEIDLDFVNRMRLGQGREPITRALIPGYLSGY